MRGLAEKARFDGRTGTLVALACSVAMASAATGHGQEPPPWPFDPRPLKELRQSPRKVFAHYFTPFPISLDNRDPKTDYYATGYLDPEGEKGKHRACGGYLRDRPLPRPPRKEKDWAALDLEEEVRRAAAIGLDGFACDLLADSGALWQRTLALLDAAARADPGFKILLMPDMEAVFKGQPGKLKEAVHALAKHPAVLRLDDGRLVVSPFNAQNRPAEWWKEWLGEMKKEGVEIAFVPLFQGWERYAKDYAPISAGLSDWGWRVPTGNRQWRSVPARAHKYAPIWMMPVAPQDMRPNQMIYWEAGNSESYRVIWEAAIEGGADWVQLITWNDYSEHAHIAPSLCTQWAFYDLAAYYAQWFKTGQRPAIVRDVLYYFHRTQPTTAAPDAAKQPKRFAVQGGEKPRDEVELLAFLVQPGTLEIEIAGQKQQKEADAGSTSFKVPLAKGRPVFRLLRAGKEVLKVVSQFEISDRIVVQDLLYRGGSSSRPPVPTP